jgi:hypothetical protein
MNSWKRLHDGFKELMEEEERIVQQGRPQGFCYAYVTYQEAGEVDCLVESIATESLGVRFESLATQAGIALGAPSGTLPHKYWLHQLFLDLRANNSNHILIYSDTVGVIERLFEASAIYCARLDREPLEKSAKPCEDPGLGRPETADERSERRSVVVMPILRSKRWTRGTWATKAGVGKNSVYEYLNGKRDLSVENREVLAEELGLKPEELPD